VEIGCGTGGLRRYIPRRRYIGIDPLAAGIGEDGGGGRNEAPPPVLIRGVGEKLPVGDAAIRSVILCETLDHTRDPERVLDEAWRVLEKDGVLAVMQSVRLSLPPPPLRVRIRAALGSLRRARGAGRTITDAETKTHPLTQDGLKDLVNRRFVVESGAVRDSVMFLRALRQDPAAPRVPKRNVR